MRLMRVLLATGLMLAFVLFVLSGGALNWPLVLLSLHFWVSLAIVGAGNRAWWVLGYFVVTGSLAGVAFGFLMLLPEQPSVVRPLFGFLFAPVLPGLALCAAHWFKRKRHRTDAVVASAGVAG
jgi:hypothetical protein